MNGALVCVTMAAIDPHTNAVSMRTNVLDLRPTTLTMLGIPEGTTGRGAETILGHAKTLEATAMMIATAVSPDVTCSLSAWSCPPSETRPPGHSYLSPSKCAKARDLVHWPGVRVRNRHRCLSVNSTDAVISMRTTSL